ncbi:head GIN domain-containing protein [Sphingomonas swuensis]|uniref:Head GIN domain-containing protein n=1 Tax=Sphingomonas swuensis TaxID=977800 RepID=A0ABP7S839_9SPHN
MRHLLLASATTVLLATAACSAGAKENDGPTVSRSFQVGAFDGLEVAGPFDVTVSTGKAASIRAEGPQKLIEGMEAVVERGKLVIRPQKKGWFGGMQWSGGTAKVSITVPALTNAAVAGSGNIAIDRITADRFEGEVAGSGDLTLGALSTKELKLAIAGSGEVHAAGQTDRAEYSIAGSGDLDASGLTAARAEANIAGSGNIKARVTGEAKANIAGSGDIEISGGAKCQSSKQGSGDIRCS